MLLPYSEKLNIGSLSRLFDNTSECYKFFWFQAILTHIKHGYTETTYEALIDEMIADAWYMVCEYHLNLGPRDNLESVVNRLRLISGMKPAEKKQNILAYLRICTDSEVIRIKRVLTQNVPYRLQAPFVESVRGRDWNVGTRQLALKINEESNLLYRFGDIQGLNTVIHLNPDWIQYLKENEELVDGWLQYNMIVYLQRRNPAIPGISDKLYPPQERELTKVKKYWRSLIELQPVFDIYGQTSLSATDISIDHFVPWSYVAHDEFWNLHPTTRSINSSKSNSLPDWDIYFPRLCNQEYTSYLAMWKYPKLHDEFEKLAKEHLNNLDVKQKIYRAGQDFSEFSGALQSVVEPVYQSALNSGFHNWIYRGEIVQ